MIRFFLVVAASLAAGAALAAGPAGDPDRGEQL